MKCRVGDEIIIEEEDLDGKICRLHGVVLDERERIDSDLHMYEVYGNFGLLYYGNAEYLMTEYVFEENIVEITKEAPVYIKLSEEEIDELGEFQKQRYYFLEEFMPEALTKLINEGRLKDHLDYMAHVYLDDLKSLKGTFDARDIAQHETLMSDNPAWIE